MKAFADTLRRFNDWMFGWDSAASMAIFRILMGSLAFVNFAMIALDFNVWYTEWGLFPSNFASRWSWFYDGQQSYELWRINLLHGVTSYEATLAFYILVMVACLFTALGLWTRVSQVAMAIGIITLHHRSPDILHSGDTLMRNMVIILMFADSGALYSLDRWWKKRKGKAEDPPRLMSVWPQRLVQLQLAILYLTTVLHKAKGISWMNGTATWYSMNLREFERFYMPEFTKTPPAIAFTTWSTLVIELAMATLVFAKPLRKWVLLVAIGLHLGIEYSMNIPLFAFTIMVCFIAHYEGSETQSWIKRTWERFKPKHQPQSEAAHAESAS